jgi:hypothetical protein
MNTKRWLSLYVLVGWALFSVAWFAVGLRQIADGLL